MKNLKFKTNIKCMNCVATVTPGLDAVAGEGAWSVDLQNPDRVLTVSGENLPAEAVVEAVQKAGYKATLLETAEAQEPGQ